MSVYVYLGAPLIIVLSGCYIFVSKRKHLLALLFRLEYIILGIFMILGIFLIFYMIDFYFRLIFLTFVVCEGRLGLSVLISLVRSHGRDYFNNFNILLC
ncbi:MAG: NADH dehydrogenase subunit 4L [Gammaproteobacteria bacterium]|nr:NADH dehydrogenase subunit 4L [Gammaproteobacteria bacterium]